MSDPNKKKFSGGAAAPKFKAPVTSEGNKASFDARPKPSTDRRRDAHDKPSQHFDRSVTVPLDPDPGIEADGEMDTAE